MADNDFPKVNRKNFDKVFEGGFCFSWTSGGAGVGISVDRTQIALMGKNGSGRVYHKEFVRGHTCTIVIPSTVIGGGLRGVGHSIGAAVKASAETGVFIRVKDVANPVYRIPIKDENEQYKWDEILTQWYEGEL